VQAAKEAAEASLRRENQRAFPSQPKIYEVCALDAAEVVVVAFELDADVPSAADALAVYKAQYISDARRGECN
jgi:hypothetical protein